MANSLAQFKFKEKFVRTSVINNEINFCLADVCDCLELRNPSHTANQIKDEFGTPTLNVGVVESTQNRLLEATFITEPQLYFVMMRSRSVIAKSFRKWICEEVLPAIRKTGAYIHAPAMRPAITPEQARELRADVASITCGWLGLEEQWIYNHMRVAFQVAKVKHIPQEFFPLAKQLIASKREAYREFVHFMCDLKAWFEKECLGDGTPWTPAIQKKLTLKLKRQVILPPKVDWLALADETRKK
ncbi:MAG: hypothetical protein NC211_03555 [Alistipes senegalensis]|nr:hypothetical protein [Oxalobacter formigenes]MCM1280894.1 hypothetical protein [Alistipes senegalensis]